MEFTFINWVFLLRNCQIWSVFQSSFTSNSFRIRIHIRILLKVSDPTRSGSLSGSTTLLSTVPYPTQLQGGGGGLGQGGGVVAGSILIWSSVPPAARCWQCPTPPRCGGGGTWPRGSSAPFSSSHPAPAWQKGNAKRKNVKFLSNTWTLNEVSKKSLISISIC